MVDVFHIYTVYIYMVDVTYGKHQPLTSIDMWKIVDSRAPRKWWDFLLGTVGSFSSIARVYSNQDLMSKQKQIRFFAMIYFGKCEIFSELEIKISIYIYDLCIYLVNLSESLGNLKMMMNCWILGLSYYPTLWQVHWGNALRKLLGDVWYICIIYILYIDM
jgi:hypothetical protein